MCVSVGCAAAFGGVAIFGRGRGSGNTPRLKSCFVLCKYVGALFFLLLETQVVVFSTLSRVH